MIVIELDLAPWRSALRSLRDGMDDTLEAAVAQGAEAVAFAARADHPYTNRTGRLERTTRAYAPRGTFSRDTLRAEVIATAPYASFVEDKGFKFLEPALAFVEHRIDQSLDDALESAVARAGLK